MSDRQAIKEMHKQTDRQTTMREVREGETDTNRETDRWTDD